VCFTINNNNNNNNNNINKKKKKKKNKIYNAHSHEIMNRRRVKGKLT